jgi:hypothetical protein
MIHFTEILWAQLVLVGFGALLQLAALCTFARDPHAHGGIQPDLHEPDEAHSPDGKTELPEEQPPMKIYHPHVDNMQCENISDLRPGLLQKTAKVAFKQRFDGLK